MTSLESIIAEIKSDFKSYYNSGLLDELSMQRWGVQALKMFGVDIMVLQDEVITVEGGRAELPENFFSLKAAYECTPIEYKVEKTPVLQKVRQWKETTERIKEFDSCDPCCVTEHEKVITERYYNDDSVFEFKYKPSGLLKLTKHVKKSEYANDCRNKYVKNSHKEISIRNNILYTNYDKGNIYIVFYGLDLDDEGDIVFTDSPKGVLSRYVEDYIKYKVVERLILNQDDTNLASMLSLLKQNQMESYRLAMTDVKFASLSLDSFRKLRMANMRDLAIFEQQINSIKRN